MKTQSLSATCRRTRRQERPTARGRELPPATAGTRSDVGTKSVRHDVTTNDLHGTAQADAWQRASQIQEYDGMPDDGLPDYSVVLVAQALQ